MQNKKGLKYFEMTGLILKCSFEIINELGIGFLESVYKNALFIALKQEGFNVIPEQQFEVVFRQQFIGYYVADLVVENSVIIETKCCNHLLPEHQAQLINYLSVSKIPVGLLLNFGKKKLEYKRVYHDTFEEKKYEIEKFTFLLNRNMDE
ncbi:MAG TPA: GxxExxY protein [Rhabdochlamydiaceae bacterium]|nr:GxxExxY protein [Rhabdochlamydiaceae bacterium]